MAGIRNVRITLPLANGEITVEIDLTDDIAAEEWSHLVASVASLRPVFVAPEPGKSNPQRDALMSHLDFPPGGPLTTDLRGDDFDQPQP